MRGITSRRGRLAAATATLALVAAPLAVATTVQAAPGDSGDTVVKVAEKPGKKKNKKKSKLVDVQLLSFNDFHGHIEANDSPQPPLPSDVKVGGSEYLAAHLDALRAKQPKRTLTVAAGDLIGGSPLLSGIFQDQPAVESLNKMGLDVSSVGNHEFDEGTDELRRMVDGGCHPDGCFKDLAGRDIPYEGTAFDYLAANVVKKANGKPFLPATTVKKVKGVRVGFIGMTLEGTDALVSPSGVASVEFLDEVKTANQQAKKLKKRGVKAIVVLLHEGGYPESDDIQACEGMSGPIVDIAQRLHPEIDHVVTGHTHEPYICNIPDRKGRDRWVTSAESYGQVITEAHLKIKKRSGQVARKKTTATNHLVLRETVEPDRQQTRLIYFWKALSDVLAGRVVGTLAPGVDITGDALTTCRCEETPMADLVADAILWGTRDAGAQIAFMNTGGVRASLLFDKVTHGEEPGEITYQEAYGVAPFNNLVVSVEMTGAEIEEVLNQQFQRISDRGSRPMLSLGVSEGFTYEWEWIGDTPEANKQPGAGTTGGRVVPGSMRLNGEPILADQTYRVATLNFLADGGDSFTAFEKGRNRIGGPEDLANLVAYLEAHPGLTAPSDRVSGL